ncbi:hypothetical protein E2C01_044014 [Portunus trituberculatus]|uniref:Uncharacterized protein n=1 Tax=Portunus trituberculatus TaxID=210409 RepID=A0A5B7FS03_PORTR|nr:hypothetical protein [Portunus trituberculatus]
MLQQREQHQKTKKARQRKRRRAKQQRNAGLTNLTFFPLLVLHRNASRFDNTHTLTAEEEQLQQVSVLASLSSFYLMSVA